ncbi:Gfo/Idh/MocA family protein [Halococcus sp. IIIV-5B]|uniref:Gfo/Idh/MocA family protein n=1 Tax=Halococcus sp. IIIV-5B TaxID=2321230 RepID=UPI000E74CD32|nr:Gfo/Idh/MocA family oxidoreductase [Halococcus sp. IIIV-5B]RJT07894.1 gfo/Idh/MocA family oxidoreductase [Halococcus sp. IIIV-5B]
MTESQLRAAIVGCGGAGRNHAAGYRNAANAELVAVCDLDRNRTDELATEYAAEPFFDLADLLTEVQPNVVSVATPERHHVEPTIMSLEEGADVFCEKIMAHSLDDGREMVETAERAGRTLAVDYNYRHMPSFARLAEAIEVGHLGEVHFASVDVHAYGWHHVLDLLVFLMGEPQAIRATLEHDQTVVDERFHLDDMLYVPSNAVSATIKFTNGTLASIAASIHTELSDHLIDLAVYGTDGRFRLTGMTPEDSTGTVAPGPLADDIRGVDSIDLNESFERSVEAFVNAVHSGETPPTTGADGLVRMELERAVLKANEIDGWVRL